MAYCLLYAALSRKELEDLDAVKIYANAYYSGIMCDIQSRCLQFKVIG